MIFNYLRDKDLDVIFLQETHTCKNSTKLYQNEWGSKWCATSGTSNSRGTAIIFRPGTKLQIVKTACDHNGRYVICTVKIEEVKYTFCNIYAPNEDSPAFFNSVFKTLSKYSEENVIIGGDFNTVIEPEMDRLNSVINNHKSSKLIQAYMEDAQMVDIWRSRHPETKSHSWFKKNCSQIKASRIDFFLVNAGAASKVTDVGITASTKSDHSLITLTIRDDDLKRDPGIWKLNEQLFKQEKYCIGLEDTVEKCEANTTRAGMNKIEKWEYIKKECRKYSQQYTKNSSKKQKVLYNDLLKLNYELDMEETSAANDIHHKQIKNTLLLVQNKITELEQERLTASMYRSRYKWANHYERMNKHFFALEKRNYVNKTLFAIIRDDGTVCKEQREILNEQVKFYKILFASDKTVQFKITEINGAKLTDMQRVLLDSDIVILILCFV